MRSFALKKSRTAFFQGLALTVLHLLEQCFHELELIHSDSQSRNLALRKFMPALWRTRRGAKSEKQLACFV